MTPKSTRTSLPMNSRDVPRVVASAAKSSAPETALIQKPIHMMRNARDSSSSGSRVAKPSRRRSSTVLAPTSSASPTVCSVRIVG